MSQLSDALECLGEVFVMGFSGHTLSERSRQFVEKQNIGGLILFSKNYESPEQVCTLINALQENTSLSRWMSVDHEGGRVQRFKKGFTRIPTSRKIGMKGSPELAFRISQAMAQEVAAVGINLNYYPLADICTNPSNPVIGDRAFGETEEQVSLFCTAAVRGHLRADVQPCVKHFPGHGDTQEDSHLLLPKVTTSEDTLRNREFLPFEKAFRSGCRFVMTAHILAEALDPKNPSTLSQRTLLPLLREELGYQGIIISDDLEMKAITDHFGEEEAPILALQSGCDLLIYRSENATRKAYESLVKALESNRLDPNRVLEAAHLSRDLKKRVLRNSPKLDPKQAEERIRKAGLQKLLEENEL